MLRAIDIHGLLRRVVRQADPADARREAEPLDVGNLQGAVIAAIVVGQPVAVAVETLGFGVAGVQHRGANCNDRAVELEPGDSLLLYGAWPEVDKLVGDRDVLVVDSPDLIRRQAVPLGPKAYQAIAVLLSMVVLLAFGIVPPAIAGLLAAGAMVLTGVLSSAQAYRAVSWQTIVLVGGLIPLSTAMRTSGASDLIAERLLAVVGGHGPLLVMFGLFVLITVLGLVISNTATALIVLPVALAVAADAGISVQPILMLVAIACAASVLTPVQTPANLMVMGPGGYRFGDYAKFGLPILAFWLLVALVVVPLVWPY